MFDALPASSDLHLLHLVAAADRVDIATGQSLDLTIEQHRIRSSSVTGREISVERRAGGRRPRALRTAFVVGRDHGGFGVNAFHLALVVADKQHGGDAGLGRRRDAPDRGLVSVEHEDDVSALAYAYVDRRWNTLAPE